MDPGEARIAASISSEEKMTAKDDLSDFISVLLNFC